MRCSVIAGILLASLVEGQTIERAKRAFDAGNYAEAARLFEEAARKAPSCELQFYIGMARYREGRPGDAIIAFQSAVQCNPKLMLAHIALAEAYLQRGNQNAALAAFHRALELEPRNGAALRGAASVYVRSQTPHKAVELLEILVKVEPDNPEALVDLGAAYFATGDYEKAVPAYERALRLAPSSASAMLGLANIHLKKGEEEQAIAMLQKVARAAPRDFVPHYLMGSAYNRLGRFEEALQELNAAVRLGAGDSEVYYHLARAYGGLGKTEERRGALARFAELTRKNKEDTEAQRRATRLVEEAGPLVEAGRLQDAAARLESARELRPSDDAILFRLAGLYFDLMRDDSARNYAEEAISLAPSQWLYHYLLGLVETRAGNTERARASLETALKLNPGGAEIRRALDAIRR
jgi:tetratricopeptide (TPR) repeat protein